jgi:predicted AlkP superfamily phosphohydrolase/phosphomutase
MTPSAAQTFARPTMIPEYDWDNTYAFSLPTDQHGWIRINLRGREARGIVASEEYQGTCQQLEQLLHSLTTDEGRPLVRRVTRSANNADGHALSSLPDLIVHWENAAFSSPLKIQGSGVSIPPAGTKFTGQHSLEGFCIIRGSGDFPESDCVRARDLGQVISTMLKSPLSCGQDLP